MSTGQIDISQIKWDDSPQIDLSQVQWDDTPSPQSRIDQAFDVQAQNPPTELYGQSGTIRRALEQGLTSNLSDEMSGLLSAGASDARRSDAMAAQALPSADPRKALYQNQADDFGVLDVVRGGYRLASDALGFGDGQASKRYDEQVAQERLKNKFAEASNPKTAIAANIAGGLVTAPALSNPTGIASAARQGAAVGGLYGFGAGEGLKDSATQGAIGGAVGGVIGAGVAKSGDYLANRAAERAARGLSESDQAIIAASKEGIDLPRYMATDSGATQGLASSIGELAFLGAPIKNAENKFVQQVGGRVDDMASSLGASSPDVAGDKTLQALTNFVKTRGGAGENYKPLDEVIDQTKTTVLNATRSAVNQIAEKNKLAMLPSETSATKIVRDAINSPEGLTFEGVKALRSKIGELQSNALLQDTSKGELKSIYGALTSDLRNAAYNAGGEKGLKLFEKANREYGIASAKSKALEKIVGKDGLRSAEEVFGAIERLALNPKSNAGLLNTVMRELPKDVADEVRGTLIAKIGRNLDGDISPTGFVSAFSKIGDRQKNAIFGTKGTEYRDSIENIIQVMNRARAFEKFGNKSGTGRVVVNNLGIAGGLATVGSFIGFAKAALFGAGTYGFAKVIANPVSARKLNSILKVVDSKASDAAKAKIIQPMVTAIQKETGVEIPITQAATNQVVQPSQVSGVTPKFGKHNVTAADNTKVEVEPVIVDASELIHSFNPRYSQELQPRDRARGSSDLQVNKIIKEFDPERLGYSSESDRGAPIIGGDMMVESGNGRVEALNRIYSQGGQKAEAYKRYLTEQGFNIEGIKNPVLVRKRMGEMSQDKRVKFTQMSNKGAILEQSATEKAEQEAGMITNEMIDLIQDSGDLQSLANEKFVRSFISKLPTTEQASFRDKDNILSSEGLSRINNAVLQAAYGDSSILRRVSESLDDNIKGITGGLQIAAPQWLKLKSAIKRGDVTADFDLSQQITKAATLISDARDKGLPIDKYMQQLDAFNPIEDDVAVIINALYEKGRVISKQKIGEFFENYANEARKSGAGGNMFGDKIDPKSVLKSSYDKTVKLEDNQKLKYDQTLKDKGR